MVIDLSSCIGCGACVVACQAEKQHPRGRQGASPPRSRDALDSDRSLLPRGCLAAESTFPAGAVHAVRERAMRIGLSGRGHRTQRRGLERHGLQPLRRHAVLLEQLPYKVRRFNFLQFADFQSPGLEPLRNPEVTVRSRGVMEKMHLLRAANHGGPHRGRQGRPPHPRRRGGHRLPGGVPGPGDHVRRFERSQKPGIAVERITVGLRLVGGTEHAAAHHVLGVGYES